LHHIDTFKMKQILKHILLFVFCAITFQSFSQDIEIAIENSCSGSNNGSIEINVLPSGTGTPPYSFLWSDINGEVITPEFESQDGFSRISHLAAGQYCLLVTSLNDGCQIQTCDLIVEDLTPIITLTPTCICPAPPNASYTPYGAVNVEVSGNSTYTYAWSGTGQISNPTIANPFVYATGTYSVTVTDSQTGCTVSGEVTVGECQVDLQSLVQVVPDCNEEGTSTLSIQLPSSYGLGPFQFRWVKVGLGLLEIDEPMVGSASLMDASPGEYCLTIFTKNGCHAQFCGIEVAPYSTPVITPTVAIPNNGNNGSITLNVTGQPGPFDYVWENGQTTQNRTGLPPGDYSVTVTDAESGCSSTANIDLENCAGLFQAINDLEAEVTAMTTVGGQWIGGAINITNVSDQFPGYDFDFIWNNGAIIEDIGNLSNGTYYVTVTTSACPGENSIGDWQLCNFTLSFSQSGMNCTNSTLKVTPAGAGPFTYKWDTGATTQSIGGALHGTEYCVTVTTGAGTGCSASACHTTRSKSLSGVLLIDLQNATFGDENGSIHVNGLGGFAPYSYSWSNGMVGESIGGLGPGQYTVTVTDNCFNLVTATYLVQCEIAPNDIIAEITNVSCTSGAAGSITVTHNLPEIINSNFVFTWSNGHEGQTISNLVVGEYCVTLTETYYGCLASRCFTVAVTGTANFTVSFDENPGCYPLNEGSITANILPSNPSSPNPGPFSYSWGTWLYGSGAPPNFGNTPTIEDIPAGWYGVVVTDAMGCTASEMTLMWPPPPTAIVYVYDQELNQLSQYNPLLLCQGETGTATVSVAGSLPVSFVWQNGSQYPLTPISTAQGSLSDITPGSWSVTVTDANGCQAFAHFSVRLATTRLFGIVKPKCNESSSIILTPTGFGPFIYKWSDNGIPSNITTKDRHNLIFGEYCVTVTNVAGCTATRCFNIEIPNNSLVSVANTTDSGCGSPCTGTIDLQPNTSDPLTFAWSNGETTQDLTGVCAGEYSVTVSSGECTEVRNPIVYLNGVMDCGDVTGSYQPGTGQGSYFFVLKYFKLKAIEMSCFDSDCGLGDWFCSEIEVDPEDNIQHPGCWTGTVKVIYPSDDDGDSSNNLFSLFEVLANETNWISSRKSWKPPSAGSYEVIVRYNGTGNSLGQNCETSVIVDFYGLGNYNDVVGFNNDFWFPVPDDFKESYFGAWSCGSCSPDNRYFMNNNQEECKGSEWQFTYFHFVPNSYTEDPCNSGGTLTIIDFDDNGNAVLMDQVPVPENHAIASLPGVLPFGIPADFGCYNSGWCLFDPVPMYSDDADIDKPLLVTYAEKCEQVAFDDPGEENPNPCPANPCPNGMVCVNGNCYAECEDDFDCINGECGEDGYCVESNECNPPCPGNCVDGNCYLDQNVCDFFVEVNGQGGVNTYSFYYDGSPTTLSFSYDTYYIPDEFLVNIDGVSYPINCVATRALPAPPPAVQYQINTGSIITITVRTCGSAASKFNFTLSCQELLQQHPGERSDKNELPANQLISIYPNPFLSKIEITVPNIEAAFEGKVILLDNLGRELASRDFEFELGLNRLGIDDLQVLTKGLYHVLIKKDGDLLFSAKLVKLE
jgi:hypothetical protein